METTMNSTPDQAPGPNDDDRVEVRVMLNYGELSELITPEHSARDPLRVPAADIARDTGMPSNELPGQRLTARRTPEGGLTDFRLVNDPRL